MAQCVDIKFSAKACQLFEKFIINGDAYNFIKKKKIDKMHEI